MKTRFVLLAALALVAGAVAAHSSKAPPGPDMDKVAIILDLNEAQKAEVQKVMKEQHQKIQAEMESRRDSGTRPYREEMQELRRRNVLEMTTKLQGVLTPDQSRKLEALLQLHPGGPGHRVHRSRDEKNM